MSVFSLDADGIFTTSEGKGLETLGLAPGQVVGQSMFDLYADDPAIYRREQARAGRGNRDLFGGGERPYLGKPGSAAAGESGAVEG